MSPDIKDLIEHALESLSDAQANAGCNDLAVSNTPEMRALYHDYSMWNAPDAPPGDDQYMDWPGDEGDSQVWVNDGFLIYLMRREMGLLK